MTTDLIASGFSHYVILGCSVFGLVWGGINACFVNNVKLEADQIRVNPERATGDTAEKQKEAEQYNEMMPWDQQGVMDRMIEINKAVKDGAITFLKKEYLALAIFIALFSVLVLCAVDMPWATESKFPYTTIAFLVGAGTSMLCGYIGMMIATICNFKTTYLCSIEKFQGFKVAFQGGQVLGFCLVGLALLILEVLILSYKAALNP